MVRALLASLMVVVLAACGSSAGSGSDTGAPVTNIQTSDDDGYRGILLEKPYAVPDLTLTDTAGKPFDLATQADRTLVFFGYTNCPDICQIVMSTIASAVAKLSKDEQARLQVVFVTTDPSRDTRSVLRTYLDRFNPDFVGVTSSLEKIKALGKPLAIDIEHGKKLPSGGYEVSHGTSVVSVHAGAGDLLWTAATSPSDMAADLHKILKADS